MEEEKLSAFSQEERFAYEQSLKVLRDYNNTIRSTAEKNRAEGLAEGLAKGKAEGLAKGRADLKIELARKMLGSGMTAADVASIIGLTEDEVKTLIGE